MFRRFTKGVENGPINIITPEDGAIYMNCCKAEKVNEKTGKEM